METDDEYYPIRNIGSCLRIQKDLCELNMSNIVVREKFKFPTIINPLLKINIICEVGIIFQPLFSQIKGIEFEVSS